MIFRDNTSTGGYCLCSDCRLSIPTLINMEGHFYCERLGIIVCNVGICNLLEGRIEDDG